MELNIDISNVFQRNLEAIKKIVVTGQIISIVRKTLTELKATAMRDFFEILENSNIYNPSNHNKSDYTYKLNGNLFEFIGLDKAQKKRGAKRDYLFCNEIIDLSLEDWMQLSMRTSKRIFADYNPSFTEHWIDDKILSREDCELIKSTYLDNIQFLPVELVKEIEGLKEIDEYYWRVYGLGLRADIKEIIYTNWQEFKEQIIYDDYFYGLDFGYNNQTALIEVGIKDKKNYYGREIIYETKLTNTDLIEKLKQLITNKQKEIWADNEPDKIAEISRAGFNIKPANKSVKDGIDRVKSIKLFIKSDSYNLLKEIKNYKWKQDRGGNVLDEPIKFNDHLMDALRYAIFSYTKGEGKILSYSVM